MEIMKRVIFSIVFFFTLSSIMSQEKPLNRYFDVKLKDITPIVPEKQEYEVTIKFHTFHPIESKTYHMSAVKASWWVYASDSIVWRNVGWAEIDNLLHEPVPTVSWDEFNGWTHKIKSDDWLTEEYYSNIPQDKMEFARMMATDLPWFEVTWSILDSLEFQKEFFSKDMDNRDIEAEGSFVITSSYLKWIWSGITLHNNEICAVVKFESLSMQINTPGMKGRDMYYGEIWVSLNDKQIERFVMVEDIVGESKSDKSLFEMQRIVTFNIVK
jgi:hypothetical protein